MKFRGVKVVGAKAWRGARQYRSAG